MSKRSGKKKPFPKQQQSGSMCDFCGKWVDILTPPQAGPCVSVRYYFKGGYVPGFGHRIKIHIAHYCSSKCLVGHVGARGGRNEFDDYWDSNLSQFERFQKE